MAHFKDWAGEAAKEIDAQVGDEGNLGVEEMRSIIVKHSPIAEGVAYMRVPRCDSCARWNHINADIGVCAELSLDDSQEGYVTDGNFGCVQWKERP